MRTAGEKKRSMRHLLINRFSILTAVMITVICAYMAYSFAVTLRRGTEELADINMKAAESILGIRINEYENLLYQMYTNDDMVVWSDNINKGENAAVSVSKMRRYLSTVLNSNPFIKSIMVIMDNGRVITYDQLTSTIHENSWISRFSLGSDEMYRIASADYTNHVWPTEFGTRFANNDYWLFDPATDPVINILPDLYFLHCAVMILVLMILGSILCAWAYRAEKRKNNKWSGVLCIDHSNKPIRNEIPKKYN